MSVIVRGMKMPKKCLTCPCLEYNMFDDDIDGYCKTLKTKITNSDERHPNCPLVEIPTPHGRLIDADELIDGCEKLMRMLDPESKEYLRVFAIKSYLMWAAEYAVIKAEEKNI